MEPTCSWVIKSWRKDRFFLDYCLRSLAKRAKGFKETVVLLPIGDEPHFAGTNFHGARTIWVHEFPKMSPYLSQQVHKCHADEYVDASYIFYTDSDTFATRQFHANDFFAPDGRPIHLFRNYSSVHDPVAKQWQEVVEKTLTFPVQMETMCSHPFIHKRETLAAFRQFIAETHLCSLADFVAQQPGNSWSEFNCLGAWALACTPENYAWRRAGTPDEKPSPLIQAWSWAEEGDPQGLTEERKAMYEKSLAE